MIIKPQKKIKGITLVEMLVYLTIFGMIFLTIISFLLTVATNNQKAESRKEMERATMFIMEHISDSFSRTHTVDIGSSIFSNDNGRLRVTNGVSYFDYSIIDTKLAVNNSGISSYLVNSDIQVTKFLVERVNSKSATIIGARISLTVTSIKLPGSTRSIQTSFLFK
jgi:Tfp pilus assembly protein PilV